jgi:hypothetical protein
MNLRGGGGLGAAAAHACSGMSHVTHHATAAGSDSASAAMKSEIMWPCIFHDFPPALTHFLCTWRARMKTRSVAKLMAQRMEAETARLAICTLSSGGSTSFKQSRLKSIDGDSVRSN